MDEKTAGALEQILGHRFADRSLLEEAFVHSSYHHENPAFSLPSNERLEFLGDAFIGYVVAQTLFNGFPEEPEGTLTRLRAGMVQRDTMARITRELGLGQYLLMGRGEERTGGRERGSNLSALYEAVAAALLLDGGEEVARRFVNSTLQPVMQQVVSGTLGADYKSQLQEHCQARRWTAPEYQIISEEGPPHAKRFQVTVLVQGEVLGRGLGSNRQRAEKDAARQALEALGQLEPGVDG